MKTRFLLALIAGSLLVLSACNPDARMSEQGFRLPEGDAAAGREAFVYMQCHQCHTVEGEEFPVIPGQEAPYVKLGGSTTRVKTYGQLVSGIINPSHKLARGYALTLITDDGESRMYNYNQHMTVQELVDLVMYLQPKYDVVVPQYRYRIYPAT